MGSIQPSQASLDQVSSMQNQMTNQQYNQGLSGSTMGEHALGAGEMNAFQHDQVNQAKAGNGE